MLHLRPFVVLGLLLATWAGPLRAQAVHGQLLDRQTGQGVDGALVLLLDSSAARVGGVLTDQAGRFHLQAPGPGRYTLRVERIGYETVSYDVVRVGAIPVAGIVLETRPSAIELEELRVEGEQQCTIRPAEGLEIARVWDEARKALTVQEWTAAEGLYHFELVHYERGLHPDSRTILSEERQRTVFVNQNPIRSLPVQELLDEGFVRTDEDGTPTYYGPDASVLLSDIFLDTHCFRLRTSDESPDLVGLSFEPAGQRDVPDILGTLWLDRGTAELMQLDYGYDWTPWREVRGVAEGRVEFQKMPNGALIVRKWWIRMPILGRVRGVSNGGYPVLRLVEIREVGSEVADVTLTGQRRILAGDPRPRGSLRGSAWDSIRSRPLAGATVYLSGTSYDAVTDTAGHFSMEGVAQGTYTASVTHPSLDSLGIFPQGIPVDIRAGETADVQLGPPAKAPFMESVCGEALWQDGDGFVTGTVRRGGEALPGATVTVAWSRLRRNDAGQVVGRTTRDLLVVTDARGRYRACGVPAGATVTAHAAMGDPVEQGPSREAEVGEGGVVVLDLTLDPALDPALELGVGGIVELGRGGAPAPDTSR